MLFGAGRGSCPPAHLELMSPGLRGLHHRSCHHVTQPPPPSAKCCPPRPAAPSPMSPVSPRQGTATRTLTQGELGGQAEQEGGGGGTRRSHRRGHFGRVASARAACPREPRPGLAPPCVTAAGRPPAPFLFLPCHVRARSPCSRQPGGMWWPGVTPGDMGVPPAGMSPAVGDRGVPGLMHGRAGEEEAAAGGCGGTICKPQQGGDTRRSPAAQGHARNRCPRGWWLRVSPFHTASGTSCHPLHAPSPVLCGPRDVVLAPRVTPQLVTAGDTAQGKASLGKGTKCPQNVLEGQQGRQGDPRDRARDKRASRKRREGQWGQGDRNGDMGTGQGGEG